MQLNGKQYKTIEKNLNVILVDKDQWKSSYLDTYNQNE